MWDSHTYIYTSDLPQCVFGDITTEQKVLQYTLKFISIPELHEQPQEISDNFNTAHEDTSIKMKA